MNSAEIRNRFLNFFKDRGHAIVPSSSLIPDDPSVLLTTAGMQQFKKYFTGEVDPTKDFGSRRAISIQKAFRTGDIDEVGDESHLTFFEMLGHFSFGDYFKNETIAWTFEFLTKVLKIHIDRIMATVFQGDNKIPFDKESYDSWLQFLPEKQIKKGSRGDNIWGPVGADGPCGAANEVYVDGVEVATLVFMEYFCAKDGSLTPLSQKGVDVGWGFERVTMIAEGAKNIFETDLFIDLGDLPTIMDIRVKRIMLDHCRAIAFLVADGVRPGNKDQGYILRRLIRRAMAHFYQASRGSFSGGDILGDDFLTIERLLSAVVKKYCDTYPELKAEIILPVFREENSKFRRAINSGLRELKKTQTIDAKTAFRLYESFGLTFEVVKDFGGEKAKNLKREEFDEEFKRHQEKSRAGAEKKFGGHGLILNTGELKAADEEELKKVTRLHTATHMLQQALREVLGEKVRQAGSDITAERTRFDFTFSRKLTSEEIKKIENLVNKKIEENLPMRKITMPLEEAKKTGAIHVFSAKGGRSSRELSPEGSAFGGKEQYPDPVNVYFIGDDLETAWSKEFCGGPHVTHTGEIGRFRIIKEEAVAAGIRRVRGTIE